MDKKPTDINPNSIQILRNTKDRKKAAEDASDLANSPVNEVAYKNRYEVINPKSVSTKTSLPSGEKTNKSAAAGLSSAYKSQMRSGNDPSESRVTSENYQKVYAEKLRLAEQASLLKQAEEAKNKP